MHLCIYIFIYICMYVFKYICMHVFMYLCMCSVLGPILFLVFINDLSNIQNPCHFTLFADDTTIAFSNKNIQDLEYIINETLVYIHEWLNNNILQLNIDKTNFILFHRSRIKHKLNIKINDLIIKQSSYILFLGIFIDENLNWKKQINNIKNKLNRCISLINRLKSKFNRDSL